MLHRTVVVTALSTLALAASAFAQANPRGEVTLTLGGKTVAVEYGRPSLRGRDMLGRAEVGQDWRMGADAATTLKTKADLAFAGALVPKGDYVLKARKVAEGRWRLIVNRADGTTVAEVPLESARLDQPVEVFTIELAGERDRGVFRMSWGDQAMSAPFSAK